MKFLFFGQIYSQFQQALEATTSLALSLRGHEAVHFICGPKAFNLCDVFHVDSAAGVRNFQCSGPCVGNQQEMFQKLGIQAHSIDAFWSPQEVDEATRWAATSEKISDLTKESYRGYKLFEIAKWSIYRYLRRADTVDPNFTDRWITVEMMKNARLAIDVVERILDSTSFDRIVLWNGLTITTRAMLEAAKKRGIKFYCMEHGQLVNSSIIKEDMSANPMNYEQEWQRWKNHELDESEEKWIVDYLSAREKSRENLYFYGAERKLERQELQAKLDIPADSKIVPLFTNVTWDTAMEGVHQVFPNQFDWLEKTVQYFVGKPNHTLVVRVHPAESSSKNHLSRESLYDYAKRFLGVRNFRLLAPEAGLDSYSLTRNASFGICYTSTLGIEMAWRGIPSLSSAKNHYHGKGFTWDPRSEEEYFTMLSKLCENPVLPANASELAKRYAHLFFRLASAEMDFAQEPAHAISRPLWKKIEDLMPGNFPSLDRMVSTLLGERDFVGSPDTVAMSSTAESELPYNFR